MKNEMRTQFSLTGVKTGVKYGTQPLCKTGLFFLIAISIILLHEMLLIIAVKG